MNILITGISKGLGKALYSSFLNKGNNVLGISRSIDTKISKNELKLQLDITSSNAENIINDFLNKQWTHIDMIINNAGHGSFGSNLLVVNVNEVLNQVNLHCIGALRIIKSSYKFLLKSNSPIIINITSRFGSINNHVNKLLKNKNVSYSYRIGKAAQNMLTQCLINDKTLNFIKIISVNPGLLKTDSGSIDAKYTAEEAANNFIDLIYNNKIENGNMYHLFNDEIDW